MKRFLSAAVAALVLAGGSCLAAQAPASVPAGGSVAIETRGFDHLTVQLNVVGWNKHEVSVEQTYEHNNGNHVVPTIAREGNTVKVVPSGDGSGTSLFFGLIATGGTTLGWTVHVPEDVAVVAQSGNSGMEVHEVRGPLTASTSNGGISVSGAGPVVTAETSNGGVDVSIATLGGRAPQIRIRSSNGGVSLRVPSGFRTRVTTRTFNGGTVNPFAGADGPGTASIETSNGGIDVSRTP